MDFLIVKLLGFTMILTRISAFFLVIPFFSWRTVPVRIRAAMALLLAVFFSMITRVPVNPEGVGVLRAVLYLAHEAIYGLALGLVLILLFSVVKLSGRIVERQMGMAMAETLDPLTEERAQPLGLLVEMLFIVVFLAANGHHLFLLAICRSFEIFPPGQVPTIQVLSEGVVQAGSTMLIAGLRLAAPMLAAFLLLLVILAVLSRVMPDMNILFISFPLRIALGLLMVAVFLPFINGFVVEFSDWMGKLLPL